MTASNEARSYGVNIPPLEPDEVRVYTLATSERPLTRAAAREILAALACIPVAEVAYAYVGKGKPVLRNDPTLHFSISHSETASMIAVTRVAPVGVDVERIREVPQAEAILRRFFPTHEAVNLLTSDDRETKFVDAWTRAEATVKVRGASVWEAATPDPSVTLRTLAAPDGYAAAVAVAAPEWRVTQCEYAVTTNEAV